MDYPKMYLIGSFSEIPMSYTGVAANASAEMYYINGNLVKIIYSSGLIIHFLRGCRPWVDDGHICQTGTFQEMFDSLNTVEQEEIIWNLDFWF